MKKAIFILTSVLLSWYANAQQDPLYSQYIANPIAINPAYSGTYNMLNATLVSRWQWVGLEGAPITNSLSAHSSLANNKLGAGVILVNDKFGINSNTEVHGTFAYKLKLSDEEDKVLSFGMQAGLVNNNFNYNALNLKYEDDQNFPKNQIASSAPNFGAGVFYRSEKMFAGASAPKILNSDFEGGITPTRYKRHFFVTGGYLFDLNTVIFKPSFLVKYVQGAPVSVDMNASVLFGEFIWTGISIRNLNSVVGMAQLQITDILRLGYAVDVPITKVVGASYGSHEIMLSLDLRMLKSHDIGLRYF